MISRLLLTIVLLAITPVAAMAQFANSGGAGPAGAQAALTPVSSADVTFAVVNADNRQGVTVIVARSITEEKNLCRGARSAG